jgi:hypothetical protein
MSEITTKYVIPCPVCWTPQEGNTAVLEIEKDWNGKEYIFHSAEWDCDHCNACGTVPWKNIINYPGMDGIDIGKPRGRGRGRK